MPLTGEIKREYDRKWVAKRRSDFMSDKFCVKCGSKDSLELDHIDRKEKISHCIWSWSEVRRNNEIKKCQILCKKCHREKTNEESRTKVHGFTMYQNHGCRCDVCREALREHWRDYRFRKKLKLLLARHDSNV